MHIFKMTDENYSKSRESDALAGCLIDKELIRSFKFLRSHRGDCSTEDGSCGIDHDTIYSVRKILVNERGYDPSKYLI